MDYDGKPSNVQVFINKSFEKKQAHGLTELNHLDVSLAITRSYKEMLADFAKLGPKDTITYVLRVTSD